MLVNDFGSVDIDSLLVSGAAGGTVSLPGGCMCCTTDAAGLGDAIAALSAPDVGLDAILIEASGIAEPPALIRLVLAARSATVSYGGLVYVVDSAEYLTTLATHPSVRGHVAVADLVVLNKADTVDDAESAAVREAVRAVNSTASVLAVTDAAVDPSLLFDDAPDRPADDGPRQLALDDLLRDDHHHDHLHAEFESVSLDHAGPVDPRRLAAFLERPPVGAYRIKGTVLVDRPGHADEAYVIQAVGGVVRVTRAPWGAQSPSTSLVVIGSGLDVVGADAALRAVLGPDADDEHGVLHLTRHLT
ncbi:cobalamin biosynthesis protein CobW [Gordonia spumicola]|uniref:Cobalamin biosynthesis protein CobW n=1 Tax=Gordonia spumicola TaxID=589161 RepID=A0A7I9VET6_9ACTN|nr:cobalamin biosynthesis protein CobW [Gordonia spumicola]